MKKKYIIITTGTMVGYMVFYIVLVALISHWLTINNEEEKKADAIIKAKHHE